MWKPGFWISIFFFIISHVDIGCFLFLGTLFEQPIDVEDCRTPIQRKTGRATRDVGQIHHDEGGDDNPEKDKRYMKEFLE
jgi:hypothetical protein